MEKMKIGFLIALFMSVSCHGAVIGFEKYENRIGDKVVVLYSDHSLEADDDQILIQRLYMSVYLSGRGIPFNSQSLKVKDAMDWLTKNKKQTTCLLLDVNEQKLLRGSLWSVLKCGPKVYGLMGYKQLQHQREFLCKMTKALCESKKEDVLGLVRAHTMQQRHIQSLKRRAIFSGPAFVKYLNMVFKQ